MADRAERSVVTELDVGTLGHGALNHRLDKIFNPNERRTAAPALRASHGQRAARWAFKAIESQCIADEQHGDPFLVERAEGCLNPDDTGRVVPRTRHHLCDEILLPVALCRLSKRSSLSGNLLGRRDERGVQPSDDEIVGARLQTVLQFRKCLVRAAEHDLAHGVVMEGFLELACHVPPVASRVLLLEAFEAPELDDAVDASRAR